MTTRITDNNPTCPICGRGLDEEDRCPMGEDWQNVAANDAPPSHLVIGPSCTEIIRHGSFGPIVWDRQTGDTRVATQDDIERLPVGDDLTPDEEADISE